MKHFYRVMLGVALLVGLTACTAKEPPVDNGFGGAQQLLSSGQKTATATVHAATQTARAAASSTALAITRATATADWRPTGRRSLNRDYVKFDIISTLVARYTATATATRTPTPVPTATP